MDNLPTCDIKLAAILVALGIPIREVDPVTCVVDQERGRRNEVYTFWFDVSGFGLRDKAKQLIEAYKAAREWADFKLDKEHPLYWMKGALENREVLLNWIRKDVKPMQILTAGNKTVLIGEHASAGLRAKMKAML
jgi:hypothetical protein